MTGIYVRGSNWRWVQYQWPKSIDANTVHGSDSIDNAKIEIAYWFRSTELFGYDYKK